MIRGVFRSFIRPTNCFPSSASTLSSAERSAKKTTRTAGPNVALISDTLWQREFGRDPSAVGRTIRLDDATWTIVGVMLAEADFGVLQILSSAAYARSFADRGERAQVDIWVPLQGDVTSLPRSTHPLLMVGRLANGATIAGAQSEIGGIAADLEKSFPDNAARGANVEALNAVIFGPVRPALFVLVATVALVLIVACVNVANLLLARGDTRAHEVAVRRALGASGSTLLRLFVTESVVLTATAGAAGVGLAFLGVRVDGLARTRGRSTARRRARRSAGAGGHGRDHGARRAPLRDHSGAAAQEHTGPRQSQGRDDAVVGQP